MADCTSHARAISKGVLCETPPTRPPRHLATSHQRRRPRGPVGARPLVPLPRRYAYWLKRVAVIASARAADALLLCRALVGIGGHTNAVRGVALSADGQLPASESVDGTVQ